MASKNHEEDDCAVEQCTSTTLHELIHIIGDQLTPRDVKMLKILGRIGKLVHPRLLSRVHDGFTFLNSLERSNNLTETNFRHLLDCLSIICRQDLSYLCHLRKRKPG